MNSGRGNEGGEQKWMYYGAVSSPAAGLYNFKLFIEYRDLRVVIRDWQGLHLSPMLVSISSF